MPEPQLSDLTSLFVPLKGPGAAKEDYPWALSLTYERETPRYWVYSCAEAGASFLVTVYVHKKLGAKPWALNVAITEVPPPPPEARPPRDIELE